MPYGVRVTVSLCQRSFPFLDITSKAACFVSENLGDKIELNPKS